MIKNVNQNSHKFSIFKNKVLKFPQFLKHPNNENPSKIRKFSNHQPENRTKARHSAKLTKPRKPYLVIKSFPGIVIVRSLPHQRIGHRETAEAGIIQVAERVRRNLRNQLLHHRRARLPLAQNRPVLRHVRAATIQVRRRFAVRTADSPVAAATATIAELLALLTPLPLLPLRGVGTGTTTAVRFGRPGPERERSDGEEGEEEAERGEDNG